MYWIFFNCVHSNFIFCILLYILLCRIHYNNSKKVDVQTSFVSKRMDWEANIFWLYNMFKLWWIDIEPSSFLYSQRRVLFFVYWTITGFILGECILNYKFPKRIVTNFISRCMVNHMIFYELNCDRFYFRWMYSQLETFLKKKLIVTGFIPDVFVIL